MGWGVRQGNPMRWPNCGAFLAWVAVAWFAATANGRDAIAAEYVGSTLCDGGIREFLGGLGTNAECHYVQWQLTLMTNQGAEPTFALKARFYVPEKGNPNQSAEGPEVNVRGKWKPTPKTGSDRGGYRLATGEPERSVSFTQVSEYSIHLLNTDGTLANGSGGWSYTLHRADRAEPQVEAAVARTVPDMSYKISALAKGSDVFGVFEGRTPCHGIAGELNMPQHAGCTKAKWRVTLYQEPTTKRPTTYKVEGTLFRRTPREGKWVLNSENRDPGVSVYELRGAGGEPSIRLLKADDNVLFFLNAKGEPMVGNADFSYTLHRRN